MEPMTLGSPVHSPAAGMTSPGANSGAWMPASGPAHSMLGTPSYLQTVGGGAFSTPTSALASPVPAGSAANNQQGFLPGYLIGDYNASQNMSGRGAMLSPTKMGRSFGGQQPGASSTPQTPMGQAGGVATSGHKTGFLTPTTNLVRTPSDKPVGGPPTKGLFLSTPKAQMFSTPTPTTPQLSFGATPSRPSVRRSMSIREEVLNSSSMSCQEGSTWVTVFGFPPSAASYILSQFSQYGTILQHHVPPSGNWMHLKYQTKMQAQKALSKSNRIIGGSIMIGVSVCTEPNIDDLASTSMLNQSHMLAPIGDTSVTTLNSSLGGSQLNRSMRPLTQSYKQANAENEITNKMNAPNKTNGLISKTMEYIFGW